MSAGGTIAKTIVGGLADVVLKKAPAATAGPTVGTSSVPAPSEVPVASSGEPVILAASVVILALFCVVILLVAFRVVPRRR